MDNIGFKLMTSILISVIATLYQLETDDELLIMDKGVMLSKNRTFVFDFLTKLEDYPAFFPNMIKIEEVNKAEHVSIGKRYTLHQSYLFGYSEQEALLTVINYQKPSLFEYLSDDFLKARNRLTFTDHEKDEKKTRCRWEVFSRKKSYLFKYTLGYFYQFYYSQVLREALFGLQFQIKDIK